jgi:hypothetical protein
VHPVFAKIFWCRRAQQSLNLFSPQLPSWWDIAEGRRLLCRRQKVEAKKIKGFNN